MKLEFSQRIFENYWNVVLNFMKIHPVTAKLFCMDKETWRI